MQVAINFNVELFLQYMFEDQNFGKPYFSTYLKLSMFILYLTGFFVWRSWWLQCHKNNRVNKFPLQQIHSLF